MKRVKLSLGGSESDDEQEKSGVSSPKAGPQPPDDFRCPISLELMRDPVIVSTGQVYPICVEKSFCFLSLLIPSSFLFSADL
jgi:hypothetical protein